MNLVRSVVILKVGGSLHHSIVILLKTLYYNCPDFRRRSHA
jgi:hypothetical protein